MGRSLKGRCNIRVYVPVCVCVCVPVCVCPSSPPHNPAHAVGLNNRIPPPTVHDLSGTKIASQNRSDHGGRKRARNHSAAEIAGFFASLAAKKSLAASDFWGQPQNRRKLAATVAASRRSRAISRPQRPRDTKHMTPHPRSRIRTRKQLRDLLPLPKGPSRTVNSVRSPIPY